MVRRIDIFKNLVRISGVEKDVSNIPSYSASLRYLRKERPDDVKKFMLNFKNSFDAAIVEKLDNPDKIALLEAIQLNNLDPKIFGDK